MLITMAGDLENMELVMLTPEDFEEVAELFKHHFLKKNPLREDKQKAGWRQINYCKKMWINYAKMVQMNCAKRVLRSASWP
ncbi:uncharacterized protein [Cherax quadricarinatus]|uniref:uncharacterized protein isoform X1 n=1 Tax=Cherax quadricarinatus TaxID=27406 RepID=UPI00387EC4F4